MGDRAAAMSDLSSTTQANDAASTRRSRSAFDGVVEAFIRLMLGVIVTTLAVRLLHGRIGPWEAVLMGGVLALASGFGLLVGLLAAVFALIADHLVMGASVWPPDLRSGGGLLPILFGATVILLGLYADLAKQRRNPARSMPAAGRPSSLHASTSPPKPFFSFNWRTDVLGGAPTPVDALGTFVSFAVALAAVAGAVALHRLIGPAGTALAALSGALIIAERTGPRCGLLAGALTAILLAWALPPPAGGDLARTEQLVELILFSALGWHTSESAHSLRQERAARRTLTVAGRDLSGGGEETTVRGILLQTLMRIRPAGRFEILDESGGALASHPGEPAVGDASWRSRRLEAQGRDVGEVRWRIRGGETGVGIAEEITASVIDLGASAIVSARLSAEKADMENLTRAEQLRTLLLDAVLHHFRTPLAGILGSVTSILSLPEPHDRSVHRDFLLIIKEQANRLNRYIDNFLSLARLEAGAIEVNLAEVNLETLIYDLWDSFGAIGGARRYFQVDLDVETVRSDAALLTQVFGNILENAIKYSSEESLVEVRSHRDGDRLMIEILDQGCGAPEASLSRLSERFYRSHAAKTPGLGLGLYITRSLVEILGGVLSARNRSDGQTGLVVSIGLPIAEGVS